MTYHAEAYIHEMDRKAFAVLNSFPKFVKLCEAYNANFDEKAAKFNFLSTAIRLSDKQMPEIYNLLPPICEKLGIDIPELYYVKSKEMNAATIGTTNPCIYVTSELVEKVPIKLIASVLAHECGHIACKHYLYHSIVANIINKVDGSPVGEMYMVRKFLTPGLINAFLFWDRCSELSADRAAVLCDESPEGIVDSLLKIHGYEDVNRDEFVKQAFDLRDFVNDSKSNKSIEQMIIQGESHPRLATRAYECYQWSKTDRYVELLNGTYEIEVSETKLEEDIVSAEITMEADKTSKIQLTDPAAMAQIDEALARVNSELDRYTNTADKADYAVAVLSGIFAGVIDSVFIGESTFLNGDIALSHRQVNTFIQKYAEARGLGGERLDKCISDLEQAFKVAQDNVWKGAGIGVSAKNHHLADIAHHPTPLGLACSIIVQFLRIGSFVNKEGKWHFVLVKTDFSDLVEVLAPAVLTGILNWLVVLAETKLEESEDEVPQALSNVAHLVASTPIIVEIAKCADNWFGHLVSDMGGSKNTAGGGMGIPGMFISLFYELAGMPVLKDTGLPTFINDLYENKKIDLRHEMCIYKDLGRQAIPVVFNEIYVRLLYFVGHLASEAGTNGIKNVNWKKVIPFGNRGVDRMLTIASMTFTMADTADAAVHAAIESCGNWVLFSGKFVSRFNYVGAGRAALAIVKEVSNEKKEAQLIHEKLLLTEVKTVAVIEHFNAYRAELEEKVSNYLAEDIEGFLYGFDYMKQGLQTGNSDLVIKGNVVIQKVLGREPQFTNQQEFDDLMGSDVALIL